MMNLKKVSAIATALAASMPLLALAQVTTITGGSLTSVDTLLGWLSAILNLLFILFGIAAVLCFIWAAILFLTAGGNENTRSSAWGYVKYGIIAIIIAVLSFTIIPLVQSFLAL